MSPVDGDPFFCINKIHGTPGKDVLVGSKAFRISDRMWGHVGNDRLYGYRGPDGMSGGFGQDVNYGGQGYEGLFGDAGRDTIYGGPGPDEFYAEYGERDMISCGPVYDRVESVGPKDVLANCEVSGPDGYIELGRRSVPIAACE